MIRVGNIRVPLDADFSDIAGIASKKLKIPRDKIKKAVLSKKSVDAYLSLLAAFCGCKKKIGRALHYLC